MEALVKPGILLESESSIIISKDSFSGKNLLLDEKTLFAGLKCDLDKDNIPDIYDDDIDGDGIKNLLGIMIYEKEDCQFSVGENVNSQLYQQHFGVCSLDNCPFISNSEQRDLNANGIGDVCEH